VSAEFNEAVPPGGEGTIHLKVTTEGYEGRIEKTARIYSNDAARSEIFFRIIANVRVPIHLSTYYVMIAAGEERTATKTVEIRAELDKPLVLTPVAFNLEEKLTYTLEELDKGRRYLLHFKTLPGASGSHQGFLKLQTNYEEKPELTIRIRARLARSTTFFMKSNELLTRSLS
jgi:hypothetical protein